VESLPNGESWKTGRLYQKATNPKGTNQRFQQSAFTVSPLLLINETSNHN